MHPWRAALCVIVAAGCGTPVPIVPSGSWAEALPSGEIDIVELQVDAAGAATARFGVDAETDPNQGINYCASATIPKLVLDSNGHFDTNGTMIGRGTGLTGGPPEPAAQFSGSVSGNTMSMTVTNVNGVWGRFTLTLGAPLKGVRICVD
ncbi:MAG: hypothetical protein ACHQNV_05655 [Vicinamibacteria bacterium]